ncbi:MAG: hypothetical protein Q8L98_03410 [Chlamydiales bacterium]|nr:hypothetical protein [Chlamydiales bacterium]
MNDNELFALNQQGFIPAPEESEEDFLQRVSAAKNFFASPDDFFQGMQKVPDLDWDWARHRLKDLYDFQPFSAIAYYSNVKLTPWQAAASWIIDVRPGPLCAIQLRKRFNKGSYLGLYSRDEILAHEAVHAARCAFNEPASEEFFAYFTSNVKWRRVLGPIVQRPWEVFFFFGACLIGAFLGSFWPAISLLAVAFIRLSRQHLKFRRAANTLSKAIAKPEHIRAVLFRLTDEEIKKLSQGEFIQHDGSLRHRMIQRYLIDDKKNSN